MNNNNHMNNQNNNHTNITNNNITNNNNNNITTNNITNNITTNNNTNNITSNTTTTTTHSIDAAWRAELRESMGVIASLRQAVALKTEVGGSRKVLAALQLAEESEGAALQRLIEVLQGAVPLATLLQAVLDRNASSTVRDVGSIVERVFGTLRGDEKKLAAFARIFRRDLARTEQQKRARMKQPVKGLFADCCVCGRPLGDETTVVFSCGHVAHERCASERCARCAQTDALHAVGLSFVSHRRR